MSKRSYSDVQRIYCNVDEGVFQNDTLDGPLDDQEAARLQAHQDSEEAKWCHTYEGKKYCHCEECGHEKECCVPWSEAVLKRIKKAEGKYPLIHKMMEDGRKNAELSREIQEENRKKEEKEKKTK